MQRQVPRLQHPRLVRPSSRARVFSSDNHMVLILQFVDVVYHIGIPDIKKSSYPWGESHLIMVYELLNVFLDMDH